MKKKEKYLMALAMAMGVVVAPSVSNAMHIMEGFLPMKWAAFWFAVSLPFVGIGIMKIKKLSDENANIKMMLALCGAFIFVLSSLKLPSVTGSSSHPTGVGLSAILFGPMISSVLSMIVLMFQALLLAHGGISTLGANVFSMGIAGPIVGFSVYRLCKRANINEKWGVFLAASLANLSTYIVTSIQLGLAFPSDVGGVMASVTKFMGIFAVTQVPLAISEGILTVIIWNILTTYNTEEISVLTSVRGR